MHDKPVVVLDDQGFYEPLWQLVAVLVERGFVRPAAVDRLTRVTSVDEAFAALDSHLAGKVA
jgi:predicted Rossmann-fold nucleotide-binding protein